MATMIYVMSTTLASTAAKPPANDEFPIEPQKTVGQPASQQLDFQAQGRYIYIYP